MSVDDIPFAGTNFPEDALIEVGQAGAFVLVHYRGRRSNHLYLALKDEPVYCCQCEAELEPWREVLLEHFWTHAPKRLQAKRVKMARELLGEQGCA